MNLDDLRARANFMNLLWWVYHGDKIVWHEPAPSVTSSTATSVTTKIALSVEDVKDSIKPEHAE